MKFIGINGLYAKAKRFLSASASVLDEDVKDEKKLAEILRMLGRRITELEAKSGPEGIEFEIATVGSAGLISLLHNLNGPVRWWVTCWTRPVSQGAYPTTAPILVQDASSTSNVLVLRSSTVGRAVVRVEPAFGTMEA